MYIYVYVCIYKLGLSSAPYLDVLFMCVCVCVCVCVGVGFLSKYGCMHVFVRMCCCQLLMM